MHDRLLGNVASCGTNLLPADTNVAKVHPLLCLEQQNGNMAKVEVDEVLRLCEQGSVRASTSSNPYGPHMDISPCVTKLPKFRPTMQCQVAPFFESNLGHLSARVESLLPRVD